MTTITGHTKLYGLLGWPVGHTASPAMQNAAFAAMQIDAAYVPLAVEPAKIANAINSLVTLGFAGANVTVPHKVEIMSFVDELDEMARCIGAVNTLVFQEGRAKGYNTDAPGFAASLARRQVAVRGRRVVLLGAGGAARAVAAGLAEAGAASIAVAARRPEQADWLEAATGKAGSAVALGAAAEVGTLLEECDLLVQCTSLGMAGKSLGQCPEISWDRLKKDAVCCDIVYRPLQTAFLQEAARRGHRTVTGEGMLAEQGALAFELWTGQAAPREVFYAKLHDFLQESGPG